MVKYNRKWCLKHCPYRRNGQSLKWNYFRTLNNIYFYPIDCNNKPCLCLSSNYMLYSNNYKIIEKFIEENIDMEKTINDILFIINQKRPIL